MKTYTGFAKVYDALMKDVPYDDWAAYLHNLIQEHNNNASMVVDCACGTGAISIRLMDMGYSVIGIDNSIDMLNIASQKARDNSLRQIPFVFQDIKSFKIHKTADVVVCVCDGINYLINDGDANAFFVSAYNALNPGGLLLFDISTKHKFKNVLDGRTYGDNSEDIAYIWQNNYDEKSRLIEMLLSIFIKEGLNYKRVDERHVQREYGIDELKEALKQTGFESINVYKAFSKLPPKSRDERIQFVAIKPLV